ncbi:MAG: class I SAM-dependent methyltransferase [Rhodothermia bacterium]|nr:MAG: class I SAM-dependent methyltransferase [Rhodothermia bacterium]
MSFGKMPIANGFLSREEFEKEYFFELKPAICHNCGMFQLTEQPAPEAMFHENYAFYSGTSRYMARHFESFAKRIMDQHLTDDPFVVEIGSNDGIMLRNFANAGIRHLGIEPSANVAEVARQSGVNTLCAFFDDSFAQDIVDEYGKADAVLAANVICHIPDFCIVAKGVKQLLKPDGVFIFEDPYLGDMVAKTSYDQIYDEHVFMFSATSISNALDSQELELIDVQPQVTHGGSMRYVIAHKGSHSVSSAVVRQLEYEQSVGLTNPDTFEKFCRTCERSREKFLEVLNRGKKEGRRVIGYAATSKSTTVINYCGITDDLIEYIVDTTPSKQGMFSPGAHLPIKPHEEFSSAYPDYAVLFAWNHLNEIMQKETTYSIRGGKWIVYVPEVKVLE